MSRTENDFLIKWCKPMMDIGVIIRRSSSPWAAAPLLPPKKDDNGNVTDLRVVHDYRPHNANTEQRAYQIPSPNELIVEIATFSIFSTMDIRGAYNNLPIKEESRCKTTFWGGDGLYEYNTTPRD